MGFIVRKSTPEDMASVLELIKELAVFEKEPDAVKIDVEELIRFGYGDSPAFFTYVAEINNEIVGMALFYNRFSTWEGPSIHLEDLIVTQRFRGKGIGKALYDKVLAFALQKNVKRVEWVVLDWNKTAIDFYKSTGAVMLEDWNLCQINSDNIRKYLSHQ